MLYIKRKAILRLTFIVALLIVVILNVNKLIMLWHIRHCDWPVGDESSIGSNATKIMFISDIHIRLDDVWTYVDNKYHEWRMYYNFKYAVNVFRPEVVIVLGDVFDAGGSSTDTQFSALVHKFHRLFPFDTQSSNAGSDQNMRIINGNHDIGFHYAMTYNTKTRFDQSFETDSVKLIEINGNKLVTINSITMEGDFCQLCSQATHLLHTIAQQLCHNASHHCQHKPIVLTHFPLYRDSEALCDYDWDSIPESQRYIPYKESWDCLSNNATQLILKALRPRLVITGHTHYGCTTRHPNDLFEWTVASFNYRMNLNPTLLLATISPNAHFIRKCYLSNDLTLHAIDALILISTLFICFKLKIVFKCRRSENYNDCCC